MCLANQYQKPPLRYSSLCPVTRSFTTPYRFWIVLAHWIPCFLLIRERLYIPECFPWLSLSRACPVSSFINMVSSFLSCQSRLISAFLYAIICLLFPFPAFYSGTYLYSSSFLLRPLLTWYYFLFPAISMPLFADNYLSCKIWSVPVWIGCSLLSTINMVVYPAWRQIRTVLCLYLLILFLDCKYWPVTAQAWFWRMFLY